MIFTSMVEWNLPIKVSYKRIPWKSFELGRPNILLSGFFFLLWGGDTNKENSVKKQVFWPKKDNFNPLLNHSMLKIFSNFLLEGGPFAEKIRSVVFCGFPNDYYRLAIFSSYFCYTGMCIKLLGKAFVVDVQEYITRPVFNHKFYWLLSLFHFPSSPPSLALTFPLAWRSFCFCSFISCPFFQDLH